MDLGEIDLRVSLYQEKIKDIAKEMNIDPRTLRQRLCRWRKKAQKRLTYLVPLEDEFLKYLSLHRWDSTDHEKLAARIIDSKRDLSNVRRVLKIIQEMPILRNIKRDI